MKKLIVQGVLTLVVFLGVIAALLLDLALVLYKAAVIVLKIAGFMFLSGLAYMLVRALVFHHLPPIY